MATAPNTVSSLKTKMSKATTSEELLRQTQLSDRKFRLVCEQLVLLDGQLAACQARYDRAARHSPAFRAPLRLRLVTLQNVRHTYWHYMDNIADCLDELQDRLFQEFNIDWDEVCHLYK